MSNASTLTPGELIEQIFAATDAKDTAAKLALVTEDVRLVFANADAIEGREAFAATSDAFNASLTAVRHEITSLLEFAEQRTVVAELLVHYTRLDGGELALPCCNVFRLRDGLIADYRIYMDIGPVYA